MTNQANRQAEKAQEEARKARQQARAANAKLDDLKEDVKNSAAAGDPTKATTAQLITGDY